MSFSSAERKRRGGGREPSKSNFSIGSHPVRNTHCCGVYTAARIPAGDGRYMVLTRKS